MTKVYIAGPLCTVENRKFLEKIDELCNGLGFETFLPHRDAGLFEKPEDVPEISEKDFEELQKCEILVGVLDGIYVGAGTAWEMGFFHALGKKVIGLKTDRKVEESIPEISTIIVGKTKIVESLEELKKELEEIKNSQ